MLTISAERHELRRREDDYGVAESFLSLWRVLSPSCAGECFGAGPSLTWIKVQRAPAAQGRGMGVKIPHPISDNDGPDTLRARANEAERLAGQTSDAAIADTLRRLAVALREAADALEARPRGEPPPK